MRSPVALLVGSPLALAASAPRPAAAAAGDGAAPAQLAYRPAVFEQPAAPVRETRAGLEFTAVLLLANYRYWANADAWVEDQRYALSWDSQKKRLLELDGLRFDSNDYKTNSGHALAGGMYYTLGRVNNLGVKDSFLLAALESLYWEAVVEWREVVSINDSFMTTFGALSIGEPWYQLARYLTTRPDPVVRTFGFIHPLLGLQTLLDPASRPRQTAAQTLPGYGVFLALGATATDSRYPSDSGSFSTVGLRSRLALAPGYTAPGVESRQGWEVLSSTLNITADFEGDTNREVDFFSRAVFYGRVERSVAEDARGSGFLLGLGSAFTLLRKAPVAIYDTSEVRVRKGYDLQLDEPRDFRDKYTVVHLFGPVYEGYRRGAGLGVSWALEAYPDFAMVNAYALNAYSADHDIAGVKTTLLYYGYYLAWGASVKGRIDADAGPVSIGVGASLSYHESIEGLDSYEEELVADVHAADTWLRFDVHVGVPIPRTPLALEAAARWSSRSGTVGDTHVSGSESRFSLGISCRL